VYKGLGVLAGARRLSLNLTTTINFPNLGVTLEGTGTRAKWNPIVGADWRQPLNRKWIFATSIEGGGFTGNDQHLRLRARVDWRPISHLDLRLGYQMLHVKLSTDTFTLGGVQRSLTTSQNMYGPEFGFGFVF
jgi:hypothetical protein